MEIPDEYIPIVKKLKNGEFTIRKQKIGDEEYHVVYYKDKPFYILFEDDELDKLILQGDSTSEEILEKLQKSVLARHIEVPAINLGLLLNKYPDLILIARLKEKNIKVNELL